MLDLRIVRYKPGTIRRFPRFDVPGDIVDRVKDIISRVESEGDKALLDYLKEFHGVSGLGIRVEDWEIDRAYRMVDENAVTVIEEVADRVRRVAVRLKPSDTIIEPAAGVRVMVKWVPVGSVGGYAPGGRASYPSTVIMLGVTAREAGVESLYLSSPPRVDGMPDPLVLVTADVIGFTGIYRLGGAYAAAAMAIGTETVKRVDVLTGPGGTWYTIAKALLHRYAKIDLIAGPTELFIVADGSINPSWIAHDIAAQAEHSPDTKIVLAVTSIEYGYRVLRELDKIIGGDRDSTIYRSLSGNGILLLVNDVDEGISAANEYAPEHLYIASNNIGEEIVNKIVNAGSVSIGPYTPPALTDYATGANHILPTYAWARSEGGLTLYKFMKPIYINVVTDNGLKAICRSSINMAKWEGLPFHGKSVKIRGC